MPCALCPQLAFDDPGLIIRVAELGRPDAVALMVARGFDVNVRRRVTPLHEAAGHGDLAMVKLLLELGADPTIRDTSHSAPPAGWAEHGGHQHVVDRLADRSR